MEILRWKTRIAVLWILGAVCMSAHMILLSIDSGVTKLIAEWSASAGKAEWIATALFWLIPLWMAFITMIANGSVNRWTNFIVAIIVTLLNIWHFFICGIPLLKGGPYTYPTPHHIVILASTVVATILIIWYAWKWPKQEG